MTPLLRSHAPQRAASEGEGVWHRRFYEGEGGPTARDAAARADSILGLRDYGREPRREEGELDGTWLGELSRDIDEAWEGITDAIDEWLNGGGEDEEYVIQEGSVGRSSTAGAQSLAQTLAITVLVVAIAIIVALLVRRYLAVERTRTVVAAPSVTSRVAELRELARLAAERGEWIEALRLEFFALVVGLGERGDLQYRDAWTNRELLDRGAPRPAVSRALLPIVGRLDEHSFGRRPSGPDEVREFRDVCDRLLEAHS